MNAKVQLVTQLRYTLSDVNQIEAQLRSSLRTLLKRVARERAVVIPPLGWHAAPWETPAQKPEEHLLLAGEQGLQKLKRGEGEASLTDVEVLGLEAIVLLIARPALFVTDGNFVSPPEPRPDSKSAAWDCAREVC
jgi:hypothetical protein